MERALGVDTQATVRPGSACGSLEALGTLTRTAGKKRVLIVDLTAALLPGELIEWLARHHAENAFPATSLVHVPCIPPPVLVEVEFLASLARGLPGVPARLLPRDFRAALAGIERAVQTAGQGAPLRLGRLAPLSAEELASRGWPYAVPLENPEDVDVLRHVLERCATAVDPERHGEPLDHWIEAARSHRYARLAKLRSHTPKAPRANGSVARRVLYVQSPSAFSGVEQVLLRLAQGIAGEYAVPFQAAALIAAPGTLTDRLTRAGVDVHVARRNFAQDSVENFLYSHALLDALRPAIVHAHTIAGVPFSCAMVERNVPFIQHVHVALERSLALLADQIAIATAVIAVSDFVRSRLIRLGADPDRIHVIRNGIQLPPVEEASDTHRAAVRARVRQSIGIGDEVPVILVVARFAANKRHDVALDAFARLLTRLHAAHLLLVGEAFAGDAPVVDDLEHQITRLRIRHRVHRVGFWQEMSSLYAASDVLLLPSEDDPLPLTVLEAMAAGVPVVASRSGGTPEIIEPGISGVLVEPGDAGTFATALAELLMDEQLRMKLTEDALARCRGEFSFHHFVQRVGSLYDRLLSR